MYIGQQYSFYFIIIIAKFIVHNELHTNNHYQAFIFLALGNGFDLSKEKENVSRIERKLVMQHGVFLGRIEKQNTYESPNHHRYHVPETTEPANVFVRRELLLLFTIFILLSVYIGLERYNYLGNAVAKLNI